MEDLLDQALETLAVEEEATNNGRRVSENLVSVSSDFSVTRPLPHLISTHALKLKNEKIDC